MFVNINRVRFSRMKNPTYIDKIGLTMICKKHGDTLFKNSTNVTASPWTA